MSLLALTLAVCLVADAPSRGLALQGDAATLPRLQPPVRLHFMAADSEPLPRPPDMTDGPALKPHEVFGFAPYWTLPGESAYRLGGLTTVAYFAVDVSADGSLIKTGNGWNGYQSQQLVDLINRAHRRGTRVVLTAESFDDATLHKLASNPAAGIRLGAELTAATRAKNLDGVNLDFEGRNSADREGIARLIDSVAIALHGADDHWQVSIDTYSTSAEDQSGFFDVQAIAPAVDAFFVMAYDMGLGSTPSANAPLSGPQWNDTETVSSYVAVVSAHKVLLGIPLYGYDWSVSDNTMDAQPTGPPTPVSYAQIAQHRFPEFWDPSTQTPWTRYQTADGAWHQIRYDDPTSIALKARLAAGEGLRGVGVWALGMDGNSPTVTAALLGGAAPLNLAAAALVSSSTSSGGRAKSEGKNALVPTPGPSSGATPVVGRVDDLRATSTPYNEIRLSWQSVPGGLGGVRYQLFASKQANFQAASADMVAETNATSFAHTGLGLAEEWHYLVRAIDAKGDVGPTSTEASATTGDAFLIEAESLLPKSGSQADLSRQENCCGVVWSAGAQLLFSASGTGESATLPLPSLPPGNYDLSLEPTFGPTNGTLGIEIDSKTRLPTVDEYGKALECAPQAIDLGDVKLSGNTDSLRLTVVGKNALSTGYQLGIDYFVFRPRAASAVTAITEQRSTSS